jgi:hypothetical protein
MADLCTECMDNLRSGYVRRRRRELDKGVVQTSIPALQKGNPRLIIVDHMLLSR